MGRAAFAMIEEVRRQFREIPGLMEGKAEADFRRCVDISTAAAIKEMIVPGLIAVLTPVAVGFLGGTEMLGGLLAGVTATGVLMALFQSNAGGAWDNAKKHIEGGALRRQGQRCPQGRRGRRHRGRSLQGHLGPQPEHPDQADVGHQRGDRADADQVNPRLPF